MTFLFETQELMLSDGRALRTHGIYLDYVNYLKERI